MDAREDRGPVREAAQQLTADDVIDLVGALSGVAVVTASEEGGEPSVAWGDTFFFFDPGDVEADRRFPFATIVTQDYPGFDTASDLARDGVFRVNITVGREMFEDLLGYPPVRHGDHDPDYRASDVLLPHPLYGRQSWVSVVSPLANTAEQVRSLLEHAHRHAAARHRGGRSGRGSLRHR